MATLKNINRCDCIDVSHWNKPRQGTFLSDRSVGLMMIKATEGQTFKDPSVAQHLDTAKKNGSHVGYYHFATWNPTSIEDDAMREAFAFVKHIESFKVRPVVVALDIEVNKKGLTASQANRWISAFRKEMEHYDCPLMLYSYTSFLNSLKIGREHNDMPLWIAAYIKDIKRKGALPIGWDRYDMWQYTNKHNITLFEGGVDANVIHDDSFLNRYKSNV